MQSSYAAFVDEFYENVPHMGSESKKNIRSEFDTVSAFLKANRKELQEVHLVSEAQAERTVALRALLADGAGLEENLLRILILNFLKRQRENLTDRETIADLNINPYLVGLLDFDSPEALVKFYTYQSIGRGLVTAMGDEFETWATVLGLEETDQTGFDCEVRRDGTRHFVQVKSGPDVLNKDMLENLASNFERAAEAHPGCECLLGLCYGNQSEISGKIRRYLPGEGFENVRIGSDFWEFVTGDPDTHERLVRIIDETTQSFDEYLAVVDPEAATADHDTFHELLAARTERLLAEWHDSYGEGAESIDAMLGE
jgi:hypothetical protein